MKRLLIFGLVFLAGLAAIAFAELRNADAPVSPRAILNFIADTQREISRLPARATRLSDAEEIRAGTQIATHYAVPASSMTEEDRATQEYIERIGQRVAARAKRKLPYKFHYVPDADFVNAFALPGGPVFMGKGLLNLMKTEDELAAVLGHEIEHIDLYHCAERLQLETRLRRIPLGGLLALPVVVFQTGYNKAQELEADRQGTRLAVQASYSPYGAVDTFRTMQKLRETAMRESGSKSVARTPQGEISQVALETLRGYFRSHPPPDERIRQIEGMIARLGWQHLTAQRPLAIASPQPVTPLKPGEMLRTR